MVLVIPLMILPTATATKFRHLSHPLTLIPRDIAINLTEKYQETLCPFITSLVKFLD